MTESMLANAKVRTLIRVRQVVQSGLGAHELWTVSVYECKRPGLGHDYVVRSELVGLEHPCFPDYADTHMPDGVVRLSDKVFNNNLGAARKRACELADLLQHYYISGRGWTREDF